MMELSDFLRSVKTFIGFSPTDLNVLERSFRVDRFSPGHVLLEEGKKGHALYILMEGEVEVTRRHPVFAKTEQLGVINPGEVFGLQSLVDEKPRFSTCRAKTAITVASLPKVVFNLLYNSNLTLAERFQFIIARQLVHELRQFDEQLKTVSDDTSLNEFYDRFTDG